MADMHTKGPNVHWLTTLLVHTQFKLLESKPTVTFPSEMLFWSTHCLGFAFKISSEIK